MMGRFPYTIFIKLLKFKAMKKIQKSILFCLSLLMLSASVMAFTPPSISPADSPNTQLRKEIIKLIDRPSINNSTEEKLEISFMVTKANEVVVLNVDTDQAYLENYIKSSLNYKTIKTEGIKINTPYRVKVKLLQ